MAPVDLGPVGEFLQQFGVREVVEENFTLVILGLTAIIAVVYFVFGREKPVLAGYTAPDAHFPLIKRTEVTHNTRIFRFGLPDKTRPLGLPTGQHISLGAPIGENGRMLRRSYTPISDDDDKGYFDLLIKVYPQGKMTTHLDQLKIGDTIAVKGPKGRFQYAPNKFRALGMLAGGTGITPMTQIVKAILKNPADKTDIRLLFGNLTADDILLREQLQQWSDNHSDQFDCYHVLNKAPEGWTQGEGFITREMIKERCPPPADDIRILLCGPPPMIKAMKGHLEEMGYTQNMIFGF